MDEDEASGMTGSSVRVRKSKIHQVILVEKKHSSPDRYGSSSSLAKRDASSFGFPEDMRISKLLNRLCAERSVDGALDLCGKLKGVIVDPTNSNYIRRSFDSILESCLTVIQDGPEECQSHMVEILAKIGVVMRSDFTQFRSGVLKSFKSSKNLRSILMRVLQVTLELMRESEIDISNQIPKLLDSLKDFLEKTDNVEVFTSVSGVIETVAGQYPVHFRSYFTDIVDILVGWHLEMEQSVQVKLHCGKILESFRPFWLRDIKFTERLLDQIIEDIVLHGEEQQKPLVFASFVGAFNTILKCIDVSSEASFAAIGEEFLLKGFTKIFSAAYVTLEQSTEEEVITSVNECVALLFGCQGFDASKEEIQQLIEIQLESIERFSPDQLLSLIFIIVAFLRAMKTKISMEFIDLLLKHPHLERMRFSRDSRIREALVKLWQEIVDVKNVAILEKAYAQIIAELESAMEVLRNPEGECLMTRERGKFLIIFHLNSLARLAASSTSIIALYTLRPSLLDMLTTRLSVTDEIWRQYPLVHHGILGLLVAHCSNNGNFISSSGLLKAKVSHMINRMTPEDQTESPTSDNFELILSTIDSLLKQQKIPQHSLNLLLDWTHQLILQASAHGEALKDNVTFSGILQSVIEMPERVKSAEILTDLLDKFPTLDEKLFPGLAEVCCIEMCSTDSHIRDIYSDIFGKLPLNIALRQVNDFTGTARKWNSHIREMKLWHKNQAITNEIWPSHFKLFLDGVSFSASTDFCENLLREMFKSAWTVKSPDYREAALRDIRCLVAWIQWEAAQFCVANKLRTPFGKPQETFLKIEAIVKEDARILDLKETAKVARIETIIANQRHARILLGFMEALEKAIYSATEGTAFAMPSPEKPARSFFLLNSSTCTEWFNRIRTAVDLVALHCMEPEMVIRYSEMTIRNLVETNRVAEPLFEHTLMSLAWALLRNGESDALSGLYTWTKKVSGRRLTWLKMAAEQAAGHRETAAAGYLEILEADPKLDKHIREFIADQLVQCLLWSMQWRKLEEFLLLEEAKAIPRVTIPLINITAKQVNCLMRWDNDENVAEECLSNWEVLTEETEFSNNFSYHNIISLAENTISCCIFPGEKTLSPNVLKTCSKILQNGLQEALRTHSQEHLNNLTVMNHVCQKVARGDDSVDSLSVDKIFGSLNLSRILYWAEFLCGYTDTVDDDNAMLRLDLVSMARKEGNLHLCKRELEHYYAKTFGTLPSSSLEVACQALMEEMPDFSVNLSRAVYETSKLLYCFPEKREFALQFTAATALGILSHPDPQICERSSRMLLTIAEWLLPEDEKLLRENPLHQLLSQIPDEFTDNNVIPGIDMATGRLIGAAVKQCPDLAKAWNAFGGWCYKWGRKMVENRPSNTLFQPSDISSIARAIPEAKQEEVERVVEILSEHKVPMEIDDIELGDGSSTELESHLRRIPSLDISSEQMQVIVGIWRRAHKHVYGYYEMAADAYFKYLQLGAVGEEGASSTVAATLRLLRLIVKHALGLQEVLEEGLASTPTSPWKVIIPQLFSRLNHHEPYVRRRVSELLCRVAEDSPHMIIFPAVVGAAQGKENTLSECFYSLLDTLSSQASDTVAQVQLLVRELRRVCLLWDEMCLVTMSQVYVESGKKFAELEAQIAQEGITDGNYGALAERFHQLMKPIVVAMEKLKRTISGETETKHEAAFQERFSKAIAELCDLLREPMKRESPLMPWHRFKSLCGVFQQRVQKRSNYVVKMSDISPVLAGFRDTAVSMPGIESGKQHIYIRSVENIVHILNTKTKPKKLAFSGSDGNRYTYLFKGLEDLHLDERIMQFLSIANSMMTRTIDCNGNVSTYRARHYSVIPLGPQSGLISWVDGVLPIFSVYKKWQQREAAKPRKDKEISPILRPSELFFSKLTPKLRERGMKVTDSRATWPVEVLRDVLVELAAETPRDLLSREFWCSSTTAAEWRQIVRNYSLSLAVMSVIGYIIGLGDRHLDNVLVNLSTGEIVHIDYNVCFEKGKTLRVPEKIPFRMTQNLENALGVTGIEGTFRLACENVLKALKRGRETLLTLLEAFVYDPLVDWAVGEDDDTTNGYVEAKQTSNEDREMLKLRCSTVDALKELREVMKHVEAANMDLAEITKNITNFEAQKTVRDITEMKRLWKIVEYYRQHNPKSWYDLQETDKNIVLEFPENEVLEEIVTINEFIFIRNIAKEEKFKELFEEGLKLTHEMIESSLEQFDRVQKMIEKIFMYKDAQPFVQGSKFKLELCESIKKCKEIIEQQRFNEVEKTFFEAFTICISETAYYNCYWTYENSYRFWFDTRDMKEFRGTLQNLEQKYASFQYPSVYRNLVIHATLVEICATIKTNMFKVEIIKGRTCSYSDFPPTFGTEREIYEVLNTAEIILFQNSEGINMFEDIIIFWKRIFVSVKNNAEAVLSLTQKILNDDSTVLTMITTVSALQHDDVSLKQMIMDTIQELTSGDISPSNALSKQVQESFEQLVNKYRKERHKTTGETLLLQLYDEGFPKMDDMFREIVDILINVALPEDVERMDVVIEAKKEMEIFNPAKRAILQRLWFLRRLEVIIDHFTNALQIACTLRCENLSEKNALEKCEKLFDSHELYMLTFFAELLMPTLKFSYTLLIIGYLDALSCKLTKKRVLRETLVDFLDHFKKQLDTDIQYDEFDDINYLTVREHAEYLGLSNKLMPLINEKWDAMNAQKRVTGTFLLALGWGIGRARSFGEDYSVCNVATPFLNKLQILRDQISTSDRTLKTMQDQMNELREKLKQEELKGRKNGLNGEQFRKFFMVSNARLRQMNGLFRMTEAAIPKCNRILKHEEVLYERRQTIMRCMQWSSYNLNRIFPVKQSEMPELSDKETALMELMPESEEEITEEWFRGFETRRWRLYNEAMNELAVAKRILAEKWQEVSHQRDKITSLYANFVRISTDVRGLLKSSLKVEGKHQNATKEYLNDHRAFSSIYESLIDNLKNRTNVSDVLVEIDKLLEIIDDIFERPSQLKKYHYEALAEKSEAKAKDHGSLQKRNAYAVSVWRRIRMKLEGRDPDPAKRNTVPEQVDWMIKEAMDMDNLAVLYEGWTPWV